MPGTDLPNVKLDPQNRIMTMYALTGGQLQSLSQFLWSSTFYTNAQMALFKNPMEALISVRMYPFDLANGAGVDHIWFGNLDTGVTSELLISSVVKLTLLDGTTIPFPSTYSNYLDYDPYITYDVYFPYIGFEQIPAYLIVGKRLKCEYYVDLTSGLAQMFLDMNIAEAGDPADWTPILTKTCQLGVDVQLSGTNENSRQMGILSSLLGTTVSLAAAAATGGTAGVVAGAVGLVGGSSSLLKSGEQHIYKGGIGDGMVSFCAPQKLYALITRARPLGTGYGYEGIMGLPFYQAANLHDLIGTGYTKIRSVHATATGATEGELHEIEGLLQSGVIL